MPNDFTGWLKLFWGVTITVLTLLIGFAQFQTNSKTLRPSMIVKAPHNQIEIESVDSDFSHRYPLQNVGSMAAKNVTFSIRTSYQGRTIHEDRADNIGVIQVKEETGYTIHIHKADAKVIDHNIDPILEEITVTYAGESIMRFWCDQTFTFKATYVFHAPTNRWRPHPQIASVKSEDCR